MQRLFGANKMDDKSYNECMKRIKNLILFFKINTLINIYVYIILNIDNDQCEVFNGCGFDMQGFGRCEQAGNCTDAVGWRIVRV